MVPLFRIDRFFHIAGEGWYFYMRGWKEIGPFPTKSFAEKMVPAFTENQPPREVVII